MKDIKLGKYFFLREFLRSQTAARLGRQIENPKEEIVEELRRLVVHILDPLREELGKPITVLSGWRPLWLNRLVGGAVNSDHMKGRAADFVVAGLSNANTCRLVKELDLPFRQCILEFPPNGWVHLSIDAEGKPAKKEFLTARKEGKVTVYVKGIKP